ncbi:MAG: hypothetical protein U9N33_07670 [Campylobacterota bacterium]|nr:hypothetical protein [Campylobacterota bacterium]
MFSKLLGKTKDKESTQDKQHKELVAKIAVMNLTDMKTYINNRIPDCSVDEDGLREVMHKLLEVNKKTSKRYIEIDDMDSKKRKGFDLVLNILSHKNITVTAIEQINEFLEKNRDIIEKFDQDNKQIYDSKFKDALGLAVDGINAKAELKRKMKVIGE